MAEESQLPQSPNPREVGFSVNRRAVLKGSAGVAGVAAFGGLLAACGSDSGGSATESGGGDGVDPAAASGEVTVASNYSNANPEAALQNAVDTLPNENVVVKVNVQDHNTFQENISTYLQQPDDVIPWFAGYRMRFFAAKDLLGQVNDVWDVIGTENSAGFKTASTGDDGNQYFVPFNYYAWGVHYRKSLFEEKGYSIPTTKDELIALADQMVADGITPFALGNDGKWPAMGTFDQLNFRLNGYQFHVDLMAGKESWTDDRVKNVFATFGELLEYHQDAPNGRTWEEAAAALTDKSAGMMIIGNFLAGVFPEGEADDVDFFPFPELDSAHGIDTVEAPIDGWMMAKKPSNEAAAEAVLTWFGQGGGQDAYLAKDPSVVATSSNADTSVYNALQIKAQETVASAKYVTQFLDRDTSPEFASNVAGPGIADFLSDPSSIDSILESMQEQAAVILGG